MDWNDVRKGLLSFLGDTVEPWLATLTEENDGHQLGICLYIDLFLDRIAPADVREIILRIDLKSSEPAKGFGTQLDAWELENRRSAFYNRLRSGESHEPWSYARVLELGSFIRYYVTPNTGATLDDVDRRRIRRLYFGKARGVPLAKVRRAWHGGRDRTWVVPGSEIDPLIDPLLAAKRRDATNLVNRLGLAVSGGIADGKAYMVCVRYPDGQPLEAAQPTALDADWTHGTTFFLSCGGCRGWGKSYSLTGDQEGCPELVHAPLPRLTRAYLGHDVGPCEPIEGKPELVLKEAYARLREVARMSAARSAPPPADDTTQQPAA